VVSLCADFLHKDCHAVLPNHSVGVFYKNTTESCHLSARHAEMARHHAARAAAMSERKRRR
jgi:hypothetical protein